ncbi:MAG: regulator of amino acid metabolism, contains ACT domain protein [archaeon]|nr:regulator of amino acid metabolism, contains ACT domain protein [archaeon]
MVARLMLERGISVRDGKAYCMDIEQSDTAIARAADVDRRVVRSTIKRICETPELYALYSKLKCMLLLSDSASEIGCSAFEVVPIDARVPGIMANIAKTLSDAGINIRQAIVCDPANSISSHLIIVAEGELPGQVLTAVKNCKGVASIILL